MQETSFVTGVKATLKSLEEHRGGVVAGAGLVYLLGYVVVAYQTWREGLGLVSLLSPQYLLAGLLPALMLACACLLLRAVIWLQDRQVAWIAAHLTPKARGRLLAVAVLLVLMIGSLGARTLSHVPGGPVVGLAVLLRTLLVFAGAGLTALACERAEQPELRLWTRLHNVYVLGVLPGVLLLGGVRVYANAIYPTLPWEFGGMRPCPACTCLIP